MKVAGRIATGTGVALAVLLMVLVWDVALVDQLAGVNRSLSDVHYRVSMLTLEQARTLNRIDEFTRKFEATGDLAYADRLADLRQDFARDLVELRGLSLPELQRVQVNELSGLWDSYWRLFTAFGQSQNRGAEESGPTIKLQLHHLAGIQAKLARISESAHTVVLEQALRSAEISDRARQLSWSIAASALLVCLLILWWTIRSINRPLTQLARGAEAVAEGEFSVQVETRGSDELSQLASSFNLMVQRLGEAEQAKKHFLSHVSHELKTPLASMYETNELLLEEIPGPLNEAQKRFLGLNLDSSRRLSAMISKLLDLSRLEAGVMEYEFRRRDLAEIVRTAIAGFEARAKEQRVRLLLQVPPTPIRVDCDSDRIIQVVQNLVDNALRFSPAGGELQLRIVPPGRQQVVPPWVDRTESAMRQLSDEVVLLEVVDNGPGIADENKPLVFKRFHQIHSGSAGRHTGGVGLGLAICCEIAEAHHGWIGLRDNPQGGAVFVVGLPLAASQETAAEPEERKLERRVVGA